MRTFSAWYFGGLGAAFAFAGGAPAVAWAEEPRNTSEPRVMMESGEVTNVIDAFDADDPFDIHIRLGFEYSAKSANILRETRIAKAGLTTGGFTTNLLPVAKYSETTTRLIPRIDIGLYKDLAAHVSLPIILSNARQLSAVSYDDDDDGEKKRAAFAGGADEIDDKGLFKVPFKSPARSGIEHIAAGLDLDVLNQARDGSKPTWVFGFEGRFSVGTPMHACNPGAAISCADPGDINRDGVVDKKADKTQQLEGASAKKRDPGVTRGTIGLEVRTMMSKRIKYIEPYGGFDALFEFQLDSSDYGIGDVEEALVNHPPLVGSMILGLMVIPWENREKFARLTFDLRFLGTYHSEGRDYSELFDALGSSNAPSLRSPQWQSSMANPDFSAAACTDKTADGKDNLATPCLTPSIVDEKSTRTYTTGLTDVQAYGSFRASASVMWQAGEYVKFQLGAGYSHEQSHGITGDQPCNPAVRDLPRSGPCKSGDATQGTLKASGLPNPNYRQTINAVGRRFYVDDSNTFDIFASGVVMF